MNHTIIPDIKNDLFGSGYNYYGQLGLGHNEEVHSMTAIPQKADSVSIGPHYTAVILKKHLYFTGKNSSGQFGLGDRLNRTRFTVVPRLSVSKIACGKNHTVLLTTIGEVYSSGSNKYGQLGLAHKFDVTDFVPVGIRATQIACGYNHTVILNNRYRLLFCGSNKHGQIDRNNNGFLEEYRIPNVYRIYCGPNSTFVITFNAIYACGDNRCGQLGFSDFISPHRWGKHEVDVVCHIYFGKKHTLMVLPDGVRVFGNNQLFQLPGSSEQSEKNIPIKKNIRVTNAVLGDYHTIIQSRTTTLVCGDNSFGQLGLGHSDIIRGTIVAPY